MSFDPNGIRNTESRFASTVSEDVQPTAAKCEAHPWLPCCCCSELLLLSQMLLSRAPPGGVCLLSLPKAAELGI